jgi:hypothetical protein
MCRGKGKLEGRENRELGQLWGQLVVRMLGVEGRRSSRSGGNVGQHDRHEQQ